MRNAIFGLLLFIPLMANAESGKISAFLKAVDENSVNCPGGKTDFKNLGQFQVSYDLTYALEVQNKECEKGEIPKKFQCLLGGKAAQELQAITPKEMQQHIEEYSLALDINSDIPGFMKELAQKLSKKE